MVILKANFRDPDHGYHLDSDRKVHTNNTATQKRRLDRGRIHVAS